MLKENHREAITALPKAGVKAQPERLNIASVLALAFVFARFSQQNRMSSPKSTLPNWPKTTNQTESISSTVKITFTQVAL